MCRKESFKNTSKIIGDSPTKNVTSVTKRLKFTKKQKKISHPSLWRCKWKCPFSVFLHALTVLSYATAEGLQYTLGQNFIFPEIQFRMLEY